MIKKNLLIIVPARSGSKSIKNKNMYKILRKPLINHTFESSYLINEKSKIIHCSTNSKKIQKLAKKYKINSDPLRPKKYARDFSRDLEFVNHTLSIYRKKNICFKYGLILRPTNPIRSKKSLNRSFKMFKNNKTAFSMKSIYPSKKTPFKTWIKKGKLLKPVVLIKNIHESFNSPRQKLPLTFDQTGTYEYFKINYKYKLNSISGNRIMYYEINKNESLDIDNLKDLKNFKEFI